MSDELVKMDLQKGEVLTDEHLIALQKLRPGAEWTWNGKELIWYSKDQTVPKLADLEAVKAEAVKEYQDELVKEELIQDKIRQMAIDALKAEGKIGADGKLAPPADVKGVRDG